MLKTTVAEDLSDAAHRIFTEVKVAGKRPIRWRMTQAAYELDCEFDGGLLTPASLPIVIEPMHGEPAIAIVSSDG